MAILSDRTIINKLGNGILFYPLRPESIRSCSLCLTASRYAYSLTDRKQIQISIDADYFIIKPKDTVLVWTSEAIWLNNKLGGSIHSTVGLVSQGIGHIGTRINPNWIGPLCIALNNLSNNEVRIYIENAKRPMAYVIIHQLSWPADPKKDINKDQFARLDVLRDLPNTQLIKDHFADKETQWMTNIDSLKRKMIYESDIYKQLTNNQFKKASRYFFSDSKNWFTFLAFTLSMVLLIINQVSLTNPLIAFPKNFITGIFYVLVVIWIILALLGCWNLWEAYIKSQKD